MKRNDVQSRRDIEHIIVRFYDAMLDDPIIGFIFTDVAKIDLPSHLPVIVDFWEDILFSSNKSRSKDRKSVRVQKRYHGNTLQVHLDLHLKISLRAGHFTRWLYLFNSVIDDLHFGQNVDRMKRRAEQVATSISAAISQQKKTDMNLLLPK